MSDEEQNLSRRERRAQAKTGKSGDESNENVKDRNQRLRAEAAAKRRKLRDAERTSAADEGLDAGEKVDDALVRSADASAKFLRNNFVWLQWVIILGAAGAMGVLIYEYREGVQAEKQGAKVASVIGSQFGKVATAEAEAPSDARLVDPRDEFASEEERAKKAIEAWGSLEAAKAGALKLASKLGRAGVLYDQSKFGEARAAYEKVLGDSKLALYPQMKGRALEGVGFTLEAEEKFAEAKKSFEKLGSTNLDEFKKLQKFHVARMEFLLGKKDEALKILEALDAELSKDAGPSGPTDYIGAAVRDLLKTVDPSKAAEEQQAISNEQMKDLMKQFEAMQKGGGAPGAPGMPGGIPALPDMPEMPPMGEAPDLPDDAPAPPKAPAPVAPAPVAPAPVAPAPVAPAPKAPVPVPVAPAPKTPSPVAPAAPTPAPVQPPAESP